MPEADIAEGFFGLQSDVQCWRFVPICAGRGAGEREAVGRRCVCRSVGQSRKCIQSSSHRLLEASAIPSVDSGQTFQRNSETRTCQSICNWMRPVTLLTRLTNKNGDTLGIWRDMRITRENEYYHEVSLHGVVRLTRLPGAGLSQAATVDNPVAGHEIVIIVRSPSKVAKATLIEFAAKLTEHTRVNQGLEWRTRDRRAYEVPRTATAW